MLKLFHARSLVSPDSESVKIMTQRRPSIPQPKSPVAPVSKPASAAIQAIAAKFKTALAMHQQGQLDQAETLYKEILLSQPQHFDALQLLATIAAQRKHSAAAVKLFDQALALYPNHAGVLNNRGNALRDLKRFEEALDSYERALTITPDYVEALNNRGNALSDLKRPEGALDSYDRALKIMPNYAEALYNRGNVLSDLKRPGEALDSYDRALRIMPGYAEALNSRGNALAELKRPEEALNSYELALKIKPDFAEALNCRGNALADLKHPEEALDSYNRALALKPDFAEAFNNRGNVLSCLKRPGEALDSYDRALTLNPDYAEAHNNRGNALRDLNRPEQAIASYDLALTLKPDYAEALFNRGNALSDLKRPAEALDSYNRSLMIKPDNAEALNNRGSALSDLKLPEEALDSYERALMIKSDYAEAHWNEGLCRLLLGEFALGWQKYEWRWQKEPLVNNLRNFKQPRWHGQEHLVNKTLLLHSEQGLGDTIQFCRYATQVAALGATVILEVQPPLTALLKNLADVSLVLAKGESLPDFDHHCPLLSLPLAFKTDLSTIINSRYLKSDPQKVAEWEAKLDKTGKIRIGLAWSGNKDHKNDHNRSIALDAFKGLVNDQADYYCLQKELRPEDKAILEQTRNIPFFGDALTDFTDTAALVELMDLVITVDTSVAHLAGAMGKEVWVLLPFNPDWRWLLDRSDSPWYPSARLFRQPGIGDWDNVIIEVKTALGNKHKIT